MVAVKAWVVRELGGPEVLRFEDVEAGEPADGVVRIAVRAAAINFPDALMVAGQPRQPRLAPAPVRLPLPPAALQGSLYENQKGMKTRFFETVPAQ